MTEAHSLDLLKLPEAVTGAAGPFFKEAVEKGGAKLSSITVIGSAVTADFRPGMSDINSVFVLEELDLAFLDWLARTGSKHGCKGIEAPLLMTTGFIQRSCDAFPLEFLSYQANHLVIYGCDPFGELRFDPTDVKLATEREAKRLLVHLTRGYVRCLGNRKRLKLLLITSLNAVVTVMAGVLHMSGSAPRPHKAEAIREGCKAAGVAAAPFEAVLALRDSAGAPKYDQLRTMFRELHDAVEATSLYIDRA